MLVLGEKFGLQFLLKDSQFREPGDVLFYYLGPNTKENLSCYIFGLSSNMLPKFTLYYLVFPLIRASIKMV